MTNYIQGSGKLLGGLFGKKKSTEFQQNKDTSFSTSNIGVMELVCEGEIEGFQQVFLESTPVFTTNVATADNINFPAVSFGFRKGSAIQDLPSLRTGSSVPRSVNTEVKRVNPPVVRQYSNRDIDKFVVTTRFTMSRRDDTGVFGDNCQYRISLKSGPGAFVTVIERNISGLYSSAIEIQDEVLVNNQGGTIDTFQLKIEKLSPDSTDDKLVRTIEWATTAEVVTDKITYERTAYAEMSFPSSVFTGDVERRYDIRGLLCKIPSNAVVDEIDGGLIFTGLWNGALYKSSKATTDPVWQMLEVITDDFYGVGNDIGVGDIDISDLYKISVYNNGYVGDGKGGFERRYLCSAVIRNQQKASKLMDDFCSNFNARYYNAGGKLKFWQDKPNLIVKGLISNSDVEKGKFFYSHTSSVSKANFYNVIWNNPLLNYAEDIKPVPYNRGIKLLKGVIKEEVRQFGNYRESQAIRYGRRAIYDNWLNTKTVNFKMRPKGLFYLPGDNLEISDSKRLRFQSSGLVQSGSSLTLVNLDTTVVILPNVVNTIKITNALGDVEERSVSNAPGTHNALMVTSAFTSVPSAESTWILKSGVGSTEVYTVLDTKLSKDYSIEVIAVLYNPDKWGFIENDILLDSQQALSNQLPAIVEPVTGLITMTRYILSSGEMSILNEWAIPLSPFIKSFIVEISRDNGISWQDSNIIGKISGYQIDNLSDGLYQFRISSVDITNRSSLWTYGEPYFISKINTDTDLGNPYTMLE